MSKIILIAGGTASGKTSIATAFTEQHGGLLIHHDRYYKNIAFSPDANFDEPAALDNHLLVSHLTQLKEGNAVPLPIYDFPTHRRLKEVDWVEPTDVIIVEGILTLSSPEIRAVGDMNIFVDCPSDIRLARRLQRDVIERGRSVPGVLKQYMETVRPMHFLHIEPSKQYVSLVLDGTIPIQDSVDILYAHVKQQ